jgi:hypothetical protein
VRPVAPIAALLTVMLLLLFMRRLPATRGPASLCPNNGARGAPVPRSVEPILVKTISAAKQAGSRSC